MAPPGTSLVNPDGFVAFVLADPDGRRKNFSGTTLLLPSTTAYSYTIKGDTLQITTVKNQCADRVAEIILTSEPWKRSG